MLKLEKETRFARASKSRMYAALRCEVNLDKGRACLDEGGIDDMLRQP